MHTYQYHGDHPVDIPEFGLMLIEPGDTVTASLINHPDFTQLT